jgi:hypothetical protein
VPRRSDEIGKLRAHPNRGKVRVRFAKIKALNCKADLDAMIRAGYPLPKVAKWLQEEMGEYTDVGHSSLVTTLSRYRQSMAPADLLATRNIHVAGKAAQKVQEGLDELDELEVLYRDIRERIKFGMRLERGRKKRGDKEAIPPSYNPKLTQDFTAALQVLARRHDIKMDLGIQRGSVNNGVNIDPEVARKLEEKYGEEVGKALKSPESRAKVLSIMEMIKKRAAKEQAAKDEAASEEEDATEGAG